MFRIKTCKVLINSVKQNVKICPIVQNQLYGTSRSIEKHLGLPEKPKKPLNSFFRFVKLTSPEIKVNNPNIPHKELVKIAAKKWENFDETKKKELEIQHRKEEKEYILALHEYEKSLTNEQKMQLEEIKNSLTELKEKRQFKKRLRDLGKPKRPLSAFLGFLNEDFNKRNRDKMSYKEWQLAIVEKWKALSKEEQEKYFIQQKIDYQKYKVNIEKWESSMTKMGNIDVIRKNTLLDVSVDKYLNSVQRQKKPPE